MPDYRTQSHFKKPFRKGPTGRPNAGASKQMHDAECSSCHKPCQVPFRPNGKKPVFCRDCFTPDTERDARGSFQKREFHEKRDFGAPRAFAPAAPQPDRRIDDLARELAAVNGKLDTLIQLMGGNPSLGELVQKTQAPAKKAVAKKKVAKKKA